MCNGTYSEADGGGFCKFNRTGDPSKIKFKDLKRICNELALAAAIYAKAPVPGQHQQHDYWNIIAGALHWQKAKDSWIYSFLEKLIDINGVYEDAIRFGITREDFENTAWKEILGIYPS